MQGKLKTLIIDDLKTNSSVLSSYLSSSESARDILTVHTMVNSFSSALMLFENEKSTGFDLTIIDYRLDRGKDCFQFLQALNQKTTKLGYIFLTTLRERDSSLLNQCLSLSINPPPRWFERTLYSPDSIEKFVLQVKEVCAPVYIFSYNGKQYKFRDNEIAFFYQKENYSQCFYRISSNGDLKFIEPRKTLKEILLELNSRTSLFLQCHKSFIVNRTSIIGFKKTDNDAGLLLTNYFIDDRQVVIPYTRTFKEQLDETNNLSHSVEISLKDKGLFFPHRSF